MFTTVLLIIVPTWKQPRCPSVGEQTSIFLFTEQLWKRRTNELNKTCMRTLGAHHCRGRRLPSHPPASTQHCGKGKNSGDGKAIHACQAFRRAGEGDRREREGGQAGHRYLRQWNPCVWSFFPPEYCNTLLIEHWLWISSWCHNHMKPDSVYGRILIPELWTLFIGQRSNFLFFIKHIPQYKAVMNNICTI